MTKLFIVSFFIGVNVTISTLFLLDLTAVQVEQRWRLEAVEHGYGEWIVDKDGIPHFMWKPKLEKLPTIMKSDNLLDLSEN